MNTASVMSRGERNNNPLNLRKSNNNWLGKVKPSTDPAFEQFTSLAYGFRAAMVNIRTISRRHNNQLSVAQLIRTWAPAGDGNNNPVLYTNSVCQLAKVSSATIIDFKNQSQIVSIVGAMAQVECGRKFSEEDINYAYTLI